MDGIKKKSDSELLFLDFEIFKEKFSDQVAISENNVIHQLIFRFRQSCK